MGLEKRGRVRGLGMVATPSKIFGTSLPNVISKALYASKEWYRTLPSHYTRLEVKLGSTRSELASTKRDDVNFDDLYAMMRS